jgi:aspartate--ammonia ligase
LKDLRYPDLPEQLEFFHAEEILEMYPELPRKQRETEILKKHPAIFIIGIGWPLKDGYPHEMRAADYDDWVTDTRDQTGKDTHGLNGDILVWNHVTRRRHELTSMGWTFPGSSISSSCRTTRRFCTIRFHSRSAEASANRGP